MESRIGNCYKEEAVAKKTTLNATRSSRNAKLYKHIQDKYEEFDNLPLEDNTNEIDIEKLKELVLNDRISKEEYQIKESLNILEQRKRCIDEQKLYDINKILEKAKYENNKIKEPISATSKKRKNLLSTLESTELSLEEINEAKKKYQEQLLKKDNDLSKEEQFSITRELKYKNLIEEPNEKENDKNINNTNNLSLDLFEDLKPTGNTIITKPITNEVEQNTNTITSDIYSGDTSDIDIIKSGPGNTQNDFFTNAYQFSEKDFADVEEEFFDEPKKNGFFKIILLILAIMIFIGVIIYFIGTYGLGIS